MITNAHGPLVRSFLLIVGVGSLLSAVGCGKKQKPVYPVTGQIVAGSAKKPAVGAVLFLNPVNRDADETVLPMAETDQDGRFSVTTRVSKDGAPAGEYVITILWPAARKSIFEEEGDDRLRGEFADVQKAKLRFTVMPGSSNEVPVIELP